MENGELRFDGQIKWYKGKNTLQWSMYNKNVKTGRPALSTYKVVFGNGDLATDGQC
jgi:hypothetical protein